MAKRLLAVLKRTLEPLPVLGAWAWVGGVLIILIGAVPLGASVTLAGVDEVPSTSWGIAVLLGILLLLLAIAAYRSQEELDEHAASTPRLEFGRPQGSAEDIFYTGSTSDTGALMPTPVMLWRVALENPVNGTKACDVRVLLAESTPHLPVLPINLHEKHDDARPSRQLRDIRHGEPVIFDVVAKAHSDDDLFFWRSDLPGDIAYVYHLSEAERKIIDRPLKTSGITITLRAIADPPVKVVDQEYRLLIDGRGQLNVTRLACADQSTA